MTGPRKVLPSNGGLKNPKFKYVPHGETDIAATFRRLAREQQKSQSKPANVQPMKRRA